MKEILPTHCCFDDALDFIAARLQREPRDRDDLFLVHGIALAPSGPHAGEPFAHAWVEEWNGAHGVVWESGLLDGLQVCYSVEHEEYYSALRIREFTRYTAREAWRENQRSGHYGPWKDEYRALFGGRRVLGAVEGRVA